MLKRGDSWAPDAAAKTAMPEEGDMKAIQSLLPAALMALGGCSSGEAGTISTPAATPSPSASASPTPSATSTAATPLGSLGADGWASTTTGTTGGDGAVTAKVYTVTNRSELIQAMYGGAATIATDGSFSGTLDSAKKIIQVSGTISLNMNKALTEQTADDFVRGTCASTTHGFTSEAALWTAYYAAYRPSVWGNTRVPTGMPEAARVCAANLQKKLVMLQIPSNTSIIGIGRDAKIIHGNLALGTSSAPVDNIVIRNVTFEDSFDFFPQWDPTDSTTGRWNSAFDLVSVLYATHVWIDRNSFNDGTRPDKDFPSVWTETVGTTNYAASDFKVQHHDGLVDVTKLGNLVTISNNLFQDHDKSFLIGGTDTASTTAENPSVLKVTFHDNWFKNLRQRQPRVRYGQVHVYNNYYEGTLDPAAPYPWLVGWTVGQSGKIHAENNVFVIPGATVVSLWGTSISAARTTACGTLGYTAADCASTFFDSGTVLNGAPVDVRTAINAANSAVAITGTWQPSASYSYTLKPTGSLAASILAGAGAGRP